MSGRGFFLKLEKRRILVRRLEARSAAQRRFFAGAKAAAIVRVNVRINTNVSHMYRELSVTINMIS